MKLTRRQWILLGLGSVPPLAAADAFLVEPGWLKVNRVAIQPGVKRFRVLHFTDLHFKGHGPSLHALVERINGLEPDLACFTGDIVEDASHLREALKILREIRAPLFGVPGNHDHWSGADFGAIAEAFASTGGAWLADRSADALGSRLRVTGVDEAPGKAEPRPGRINIALLHYPAWADRLARGPFDLVLAGHSHGGQVRLPLVGALTVPFDVGKYDLGLYRTAAGPLYVGAGVGWHFVRIRFFCRPEIAVIEI